MTNEELFEALDDFSGAISGYRAEIDGRVDDLEKRMNRLPAGGAAASSTSTEMKSFMGFARQGLERMESDERKALVVSDDPQAGYLAPDEFVRELTRNLVEFSPIRAAARVGKTSSGSVDLPKRTTAPTGYWVGEVEDRSESEPAYGITAVPIAEISAYCDVSNWMLEDAAFDIANELAMDFAEAFGKTEGAAFLNGDGVNRPEGLMQVSGVSEVATGAATAVTADSLRTILYDLPAYYRGRANWAMNSTTLASISKLKDGQGQYLWQPGLRDGETDLLLGRPVIECPDMPDEGAGLKPILIGDFSRYRIMDRLGMTMLRDPYTLATTGKVRFIGRRRVGGTCQLVEAFRKLKCST